MDATCAQDAVVDMCNAVTSNPDISGIGVRTAIYAQTIINMLVTSFMPDSNISFRDTSRNTYVLSFSLLASTIAQWRHGGLSLFDGLVSTMLTTLMTAFISVNYLYIRTLGLSIQIASFLFMSFWCYWGIQIWSDPSTFGLQPPPPPDPSSLTNTSSTLSLLARSIDPSSAIANCTANAQTNFVVLGRSVTATNRGLQIWALLVFALGGLAALYALPKAVKTAFQYKIHGGFAAKEAAIAMGVNEEMYGDGGGGGTTKVTSINSLIGGLGFVVIIYMIITTEQIIQRNPSVQADLSEWTFGQTLGVIMLGQQLIDCWKMWDQRKKAWLMKSWRDV